MKIELKVIPYTTAVWQQLASWQMKPTPPWANGIFAANEEGTALLGALRYAEGPGFCVFDQLTVNQQLDEENRYRVQRFLLLSAARYCAIRAVQGMLLGFQVPGWVQLPVSFIPLEPDLPARPPQPAEHVPPPKRVQQPPEEAIEAVELTEHEEGPEGDDAPTDIDDLIAKVQVRKQEKTDGTPRRRSRRAPG